MSAERVLLDRTRVSVADRGDVVWSVAAAEDLRDLAALVASHVAGLGDGSGSEDVHDLRTATRRIRTAIAIYGAPAGAHDRDAVERDFRRLARRLGAVRDLDVLLATLETATTGDGRRIERRALRPLRRAWKHERRAAATRLHRATRAPRIERLLERVTRLADAVAEDAKRGSWTVERISTRAPAVIWDAYGAVLSFDIDAHHADVAAVHQMRIAAKKLRYALERFEDALEPGAALVAQVTALQDAAGEMHDATVAADRARAMLDGVRLRSAERTAIEAFADAQRRRAEAMRPGIARNLATVRGREFRVSVSRALAGMGHVAPAR